MNNVIKRIWNRNKLVNIESLHGMAFQSEDGGHSFEISGVDDTGAVVPLSGTVAGVFRRPDNADIALTGAASGGVASVTLTDDCYAVPGRFGLTIFVTENGKKTAVYAAVGTVSTTYGGGVAGDTPQDVVDLINAIAAAVATIPASYTDLMADIAPIYSSSSLYPVGAYSWYDGHLYRCKTPITIAETWTAAHWTAAVLGDDVTLAYQCISNYNGLNLIGSVNFEYYPVFVPKGMPVTITTSDGSAFPSNGKLYYYDNNFSQINWISITSGYGNKITIILSKTTDTYFLQISGSFTVPLMINYGETALPYVEYRWPFGRAVSWRGFAPQNIDTVIDSGIYRLLSSVTYQTVPPDASGDNCTLIVYYPSFTNLRNIQVLYVEKDNSIRVYCRATSASSVFPWKRVCDEASTISVSNQNINDSNVQDICAGDFDNLPIKKMYGVASGNSPIANSPTPRGGFVFSMSQHDYDSYAAGNVQIYVDTSGRIYNRLYWGDVFTGWKSPLYDEADILRNMKVVALGDSICRGGRNSDKGFIGDVGCQWVNIGIGGASLSTKIDSSDTHDTQHFMGAANIPDELIKYATKTSESWYMTPDAVVANGGVNDYVFNAPLGTPSTTPANTDQLASALDKTTVCGGLEYLFYQMIKLYPNARHLFVITHKQNTAPWTTNSQGYTQTQMVDKIIEICKMYGVGIVNVFDQLSSYFSQNVSPTRYADDPTVTNNYLIDRDGIHPLALGYRIIYAPLVRKELL